MRIALFMTIAIVLAASMLIGASAEYDHDARDRIYNTEN